MTKPHNSEVYIFPMSYGQSQLWYLHEMDPTGTAYNIPFAFRYRGKFSPDALDTALNELIIRFEPLRTNFATVDGEAVQIVQPPRPIRAERAELACDPGEDQAIAIRCAADAEACKPFDLREDLMVRATLLQVAEDDHVLMLSFHHIAVDHIAVLRLADELKALYEAAAAGRPLPESGDELPYADFSLWQREYLSGDVLTSKLDYWRKQLEGRSTILPLPTDRPRPPVQTFKGAELKFEFSAELSTRLRDFCKQNRMSPFVALLTALKIVFYRYTGQADVTVGCPFANRSQDELERTVGLFMNLLPIASTIDGSGNFSTLAENVRRTVAAAQGQQDTPFEEIVKNLAFERNPASNPLLQIGFTFQEPPMVLELGNLSVESLSVHNGGAKLDMNFWLWDSGARVEGLAEFNTDLYAVERVQRLTGHIQQVLAGAIEKPDCAIDTLPLLSEPERTQVLREWNSTSEQLDERNTLEMFDAVAASNPDRQAVSWEGGSWTYAELYAESHKVARSLEAAGVNAEEYVGICMHRGGSLIASLLGTWRCGAAYLPLDPAYPEDRLKFMVTDSGAKLVIADTALTTRFADLPCQLLDPESIGRLEIGDDDQHPQYPQAESPAYVIYTSGSTGKPKGVQIPHRALSNFVQAMASRPGLQPDDRIAAVTTISFDISVLEIFLPLIVGASTHLISRETSADSQSLVSALAESEATVFQATPSTYRMMLAAGWQGSQSLKLLCGGEPMPKGLASELVTKSAELWNMYGPTETTVWSTVSRIDANDSTITIGTPIANTTIRIVDQNNQLLPVGVPGELLIGGAGVANGYLNRQDLNAEKFIADPFEQGGRLYRTGDTVSWTADGQLLHLGRNDRQVKLRGFRIELEEIEYVIATESGSKNVAVVTWNAGADDIRLVAYQVPSDNTKLPLMKLRKCLRKILPDFMIPQHFVELRELPLTDNGKVNRKKLPSPIVGGQLREKPKPVGPTQEMLANVWQSVLKYDGVSSEDNFFDIGGHSLLAMKVISEVKERTGFRLNARMIVMQSLAELAELIDAEGIVTATKDSAAI